ncbi:MAG: TraR/DksA C4-type zinc finger protein [Bacteroidetes bacterium]|nr:TraR/DksA C4-type zinc finger protein [Bacteroidota bacterium]
MPVSLKPLEEQSYSRKDLEYFREIISQKIHDANEELLSIEDRLSDSSSGEYSEDSTYSLHMADQGTDAMEREKAYLFAARERKFISHLTDALQRIKSGNYGICIVCGNLIEKGRLEAVPHARMCVNCKQETKLR